MTDEATNQGAPAQGTGDAIQAGGEAGQGQGDARAQFNTLRGKIADGTATSADRNHFKQLNDQLHFGAPAPTEQTQTFDVNAPRDNLSQMRPEAERHYAPAESPNDYKVKGLVPDSITPEVMQDVKELAYTMKLSPEVGGELIGRVFHHINSQVAEGLPNHLVPLAESDHKTYGNELLRGYGGDTGKMVDAVFKAEYYLRNTLPAENYAIVEQSFFGTTLNYDPVILNRFAALFDARGMKFDKATLSRMEAIKNSYAS